MANKRKLTECESTTIAISLICFFICFCIALPTYLLGCNPEVSESCVAYNPFNDAYIYKTQIELTQCRDCISYDKKHNCVSYRYYDCYNAFAYAHKGPNNSSHCYLEIAHHDSKNYAETKADKYPIGKKVSWLKQKGTVECVTSNYAYTNWLVGIIFFAFMGFSGLAIILVILGYLISVYFFDPLFFTNANNYFTSVFNPFDKNVSRYDNNPNDML